MTCAVTGYACGWLLGYPELCVICAGTALAVGVSAALLGSAARLRVRREIAPERVSRGDAAIGVLRVTNTGRRASRAFTAADRCGDRAVPVPMPRLRAGATRMSSYRLPTHARGEIGVGPLTLTLGDPFGFFRRTVDFGGQRVLVVRPRTVPLTVLASGHAASLDGPDADSSPAGTTTFASLREYVPGDDLRHIHWRTSARAGRMMVRQLVDASLPRTTVLLDTCRDAYAGDHFETAVDITASVAAAAAGKGFPVSVLAGGDALVNSRRGRGGADAVLDLLALVQPGATSVAEALGRLPGGRRNGSLIVVTGTADQAVIERVAAAAVGYQRTVLVRAGPGRAAVPESSSLSVIDAGSVAEFAAAWHRDAPR